MGRATTFGVSARVGYEPLFNVLSPGAGTGPLPPGVAQPAPTTGLFERNSWSSSTGVSLDRSWGRRDTTTLAYTYRMQEFTDDDYGDNTWHDVTAGYRRIASSQVKAGADYRYRNGEYTDSQDLVRPTVEHRVEGVHGIRRSAVAPAFLLAVARGRCRVPRVGERRAAPPSRRGCRLARATPHVRRVVELVARGRLPARPVAAPGRHRRRVYDRHRVCEHDGHAQPAHGAQSRRHLQQLGDDGRVGCERHDGRLRRDAGAPVPAHRLAGRDGQLPLLPSTATRTRRRCPRASPRSTTARPCASGLSMFFPLAGTPSRQVSRW